ncbi:hypothetical protein D9758_003570 [Tetrapyrgos nigripes]|uniref:Uncharacterized protein n=1 Tax=Tetrapyrgos nigripes TaxID=182062 RepID=A0A8H5LVK2_9AGAR|nr:hypothetical protein D9758_003570 [Tetrapyrgos nigripes]
MSASPANVWRLVDDSDARITYSPQSTATSADQGNLNLDQRNGVVFNNTVHVTRDNGTMFSFQFNGTSLASVYGNLESLSDPTQVIQIDLTCILDGKPSTSTALIGASSWNNFQFCSIDGQNEALSPGEHVLSLNITLFGDALVYMDYFVYEALSPDSALDGDILQITDRPQASASGGSRSSTQNPYDGYLSWSVGWERGVNDTNTALTTTPGSAVTINFNGTALQLYGQLTSQTPRSATYQLDGGNLEQVFQSSNTLPPGISLTGTAPYTHQLLLNLPSIPSGTHTLVLTHNGTTESMPLMIEYFLVTSLTQEEQTGISSSTPNPTPSPASHSSSSSSQRGKMIGGIVGGLVAPLVLGLMVFLWSRRRQRRRAARDQRMKELEPAPFNARTFGSESFVVVGANRRKNIGGLTMNSRGQSSEQGPELEREEARPDAQNVLPASEPLIHADSGWRMGSRNDPVSNRSNGTARSEVPPNYTET